MIRNQHNTICRLVPKTSGNYELANDNKVVIYSGRSDNDLRARLLRHHNNQKENFEYFRFETAKNAVEAYHEECRHWHLRGEYTKNKIHPAMPKGKNVPCKHCNYGKIRIHGWGG